MSQPLLKVEGLHTYFHTVDGVIKAVRGISFDVPEGGVLGVVGESGSGKTVTGLSIMGLVPRPGKIEEGSITFAGNSLLTMPESELRALRGGQIAMVFQNASSALNPTITVGEQILEVLQIHSDLTTRQSIRLSIDLMTQEVIPAIKEYQAVRQE